MEWKDKLYDHEVPPPENLWGKISQDLDSDSFVVFKQKLFHYGQQPPAGLWKKIEQLLYPGATVIPLAKKNTFKIARIAAAAAIIGIAFFTANYFLSESTGTVAPPVTQKPAANTPAANTPGTQAEPSRQESKPAGTPVIASRLLPSKNIAGARSNSPEQRIYSDGENIVLPALSTVPTDETAKTDQLDINTASNRRIRNLQGEIKEDVSLLDLPNSYFLMTGPNGQAVRVSSKFRNTIQYLNGSGNEELLDVILRESHYWKNIFREWKEKVGNSSFVPSSQNFMDISELMKLLQQNANHK
ncbi:MAG: hypothetical protein KF862_27720 [Chitinophagaceae bacterium]|nr:hypothetical protein [Chitinophagaceae bacterium]